MQPEASKATPENHKSHPNQKTNRSNQYGFNDHDEPASSLLSSGAGLAGTDEFAREAEAKIANAANFNHGSQEALQWMNLRNPIPETPGKEAAENKQAPLHSPESLLAELERHSVSKGDTRSCSVSNLIDLPNGPYPKLVSSYRAC